MGSLPLKSLPRLWPFYAWLVAFYGTWLAIVTFAGCWPTVVSHWPIALTMSVGSYVAGSTPMGGGTVAFPVLVLLFDMPGSLGRNFGLAIQSIGMVSASIYILSSGKSVDWDLLRPALIGALFGMPLGAAWVAPGISDLAVKLTFAVIWASFGIMHLVKLRELVASTGISQRWRAFDLPIGLLIGVVGGVASSITGVGIDMLIYATLVLLYRADLKLAIPTSVILMAFTSVVGIASNACLATWFPSAYAIDGEVFSNWLAAAPVVAIGAPFGALVVNLISRTPTLVIVSLLCIGQFAWTLIHEQVSGMALVGAIAGVLLFNVLFHGLYYLGRGEAPFAISSPTELATDEGEG
ncbi:sulfite exporter TauE/SafE family protein [Bremerella cremea]|uniref:Probable membrane transporter protein n=1 Tax=Bremerella cremea TaxID=1031537 RepID=A0A368KVC1_9BACT|nr:sulfite exporter TauE/SafE family protein [Bremerella cremea]RCS50518.1 sulfite exporter TauE/SafE family protein [Bremerella cremea]